MKPLESTLVLAARTLIALILLSFSVNAQGPARHALIIGNDAYPGNALKNARNDAKAVSRELADAGYATTLILDVDRAAMSTKIDGFMDTLHPGETALLYYAGHGFQLEGENYLVPVDFTVSSPSSAKAEGYALSSILERMTSHGATTQIVILDACRDNPFLSTRSTKGGWAGIGTSAGSFLAFGTSPGSTASDDPSDGHGLFTKDLLKYLTTSNQDIEEMFRKVREDVIRDSEGKQIPWIASSLIGSFHVRSELDEQSRQLVSSGSAQVLNGRRLDRIRSLSNEQNQFQELSPIEARQLDRAVVLIRGAKINDAIGILKDIISLNPACSLAVHLLGLLLHYDGRDIDAVDVYTRGLQANVADSESAAYRCAIETVSHLHTAQTDCLVAVPNEASSEAHFVYAAELYQQAQPSEAAVEVSKALSIEPSELSFALRGLIENRLGDSSSAQRDLEHASSIVAQSSTGH